MTREGHSRILTTEGLVSSIAAVVVAITLVCSSDAATASTVEVQRIIACCLVLFEESHSTFIRHLGRSFITKKRIQAPEARIGWELTLESRQDNLDSELAPNSRDTNHANRDRDSTADARLSAKGD